MFRLKLMGCASVLALGLSAPASAYPIDCAIFLCLAGGWPSNPDCNVAKAEFIRRITPLPVEPPLQLWRCPMGATAGSNSLSPMQRLNAIKAASNNSSPELPSDVDAPPQIVEASFSSDSLWANLSPYAPTLPGLPAPTLASVDFSSSDFDVVRSIRIWHVRHYSFEVRERDGPCEKRLQMDIGTYDQNLNFHWSDRAPGPIPQWLPLKDQCPSSYRGVGVEWSDTFGTHDYILVPY